MTKILIVDDSRTARMFIRQCFEIAGFNGCDFLEASHGDEALSILTLNPMIRLLVTDINMPIKDGMELLRELRDLQRFHDLPVIVISSTQNEARESELKALRVHSVLAKPLHLPKVAEALRSLRVISGMGV